MIEYMFLGAWILTLIILGIIVISTGLPDDGAGNNGDEVMVAWAGKLLYLFLLATTFYKMCEHFAGL